MRSRNMLAILTQYQLSAVFIWIIDISHDTRAERGWSLQAPYHIRPVKAMTKPRSTYQPCGQPERLGCYSGQWGCEPLVAAYQKMACSGKIEPDFRVRPNGLNIVALMASSASSTSAGERVATHQA